MALAAGGIRALWSARPEVTASLLVDFLDHVASQAWGFDYTDEIAVACRRLFNAITDAGMRGRIICATLELGLGHNRYYVIDTAVSLLNSSSLAADGRAIANALRPCRERVRAVGDRLSKANPAIRELLAEDST